MDLGVDVIYIINLESDDTRKQALEELFDRHGIANYEFLTAVDGKDLPNLASLANAKIIHTSFIDPYGILTKNIYACALSHKQALETFLASKYETCLIVEDDIVFTEDFYRFCAIDNLDELTNNIKKSNYDVFFWGRQDDNNLGSNKTEWKHIYRPNLLTPHYSAHAYQVHRESAQKLLEFIHPIKYAADVAIELSGLKVLSPKSNLIIQNRGRLDQMMLGNVLQQIWENNEKKEFATRTRDKIKYAETRHNPCIEKGLDIKWIKFINLICKHGTELKDWVYIKVT